MTILRYVGPGSIDLTSIGLGIVTYNSVVTVPTQLQAQFGALAGDLAYWVNPSPYDGEPNPETNEFTTVFLSDGTWTKPAGARLVRVVAIGAGGGGGSGGKSYSGNNAPGGGGGAGGAYLNALFPAEVLPSQVSVQVGVGGAGGASQTAGGSDGNDGADGGDTLFGTDITFLSIPGGGGGNGGASKTEGLGGTGVNAAIIPFISSPTTGSKGADGGSSTASPTAGGDGFVDTAPTGGAAGGGAGGFIEADATLHDGTDGGPNVILGIDGGGHYPGSTAPTPPNFNPTTWLPGVGGGGGDADLDATTAYAGRDGFKWGGGGGGGAPGWYNNPTIDLDSGAGGRGADGLVVVQVFF